VTGYVLRRFGTSILVVLLVSIGVFFMLHLIYPEPGIDVLGSKANAVTIAAWNKQNGFDNPWIVQYLDYIGRLLKGNLGYSYKLNQSVTQLMGEYWVHSAYLSGVSLVLAVIIAIPLGVYQAARRNTLGDYTLTSVSFILYAMPSFFLGLILIQLFALDLHWFNPYYEGSQSASFFRLIADFKDLTLPIATLTLVSIAAYSRYMRSASMDVMAQDYIRVARAKGLPERLVLFRHLVKNASLPMVTLIGLSIPNLLAGNLITEALFDYRGLGLMFLNALQDDDYNVLLAYTLVGAVLTVGGNLVADIALTVADPRIRLA
jgi:peptide/nickel transport system permease protein